MRTHRKLPVALAATLGLLVAGAAQAPAWAGTPKSAKSLAKDLLPSSYANKAGFPKVAEKATTTSKTSVKDCPDGGQVAFESASGQMGLVSEVVACKTAKAARTLLSGTQSGTAVASAVPPTSLGSSAMERSGGGSTYAIYWRRGSFIEVVALNTDVKASSNTSTSTTVAAPPLTAAQQAVLSSAAVEQDSLLK